MEPARSPRWFSVSEAWREEEGQSLNNRKKENQDYAKSEVQTRKEAPRPAIIPPLGQECW